MADRDECPKCKPKRPRRTRAAWIDPFELPRDDEPPLERDDGRERAA